MTEDEIIDLISEAITESYDVDWRSIDAARHVYGALTISKLIVPVQGEPVRKYKLGDRVTKTKGSNWTGLVVGFYSTSLTPIGYAVESETERGSVQIYPESALAAIAQAQEPQ